MRLRKRFWRFIENVTGEREQRYWRLKVIRIDRQLERLFSEAEKGYANAPNPTQRLLWKNLLLEMRMKARIRGYQCRDTFGREG